MKDRLITIATPEIIYEAWPMLNTHLEYGRARGYEHVVVKEPYWSDLHPSFSKVHEIQRALDDGCENVIWADADVAFMNHNVQLADLLGGGVWMAGYRQLNWSEWAYTCWGLTVWRNCPEAKAYIAKLVDSIENGSPYLVGGRRTPASIIGKPWEQALASELDRFYLKDFAGLRPCTADEIGCFSNELWNDGNVWKDGMPTVHFAGVSSWPDRRQTFLDHYADKVKRAG